MGNEVIPLKQRRVSYIGRPISDSVLYIGKKVEEKLSTLETVEGCLVFIETGIIVQSSLEAKHQFVFADNPVLAYAEYAQRIADEISEKECRMHYRLTEEGYYLGENVSMGNSVTVEPNALIGHGVTIGDNTTVLAGAVIKNAKIGRDCFIKEYALIGGQAFTMASDTQGRVLRVQCLGDVVIGDSVEIGSFSTVCRGSNTSTSIASYTKVDDHVHIGHDVIVERGVLLTAGSVLGGYDIIGEGAYIGMNATLKQFVEVEPGAFVSMGARAAKGVKATGESYGFPVKKTDK